MTDVNIAVDVLADGLLDRHDVAILISADSDLVPPIRKLARCAKNKRVVVCLPPNRNSKDLKRYAQGYFHIDPKDLVTFQT
jgi:uncharacterized LabA/DUF88 family protein